MLRDISIQNYRAFRNFRIDELARVNLVVGMNNSGKTSLLEAIYLLVKQGHIQSLFEILNNRGEITLDLSKRMPNRPIRQPRYKVSHLFTGHQINPEVIIKISSFKDHQLQFKVQPNIMVQLSLFETLEPELVNSQLIFTYGESSEITIPVLEDGSLIERLHSSKINPNLDVDALGKQSVFLTVNNISFQQLAAFWDGITLTPKEENVVAALQIIDPDVERISFTSQQTANSGILLKLKREPYPVPLGSMGDGMRRILTLIMATVMAENGFLLVDEIDTGLYYQAQTDMWRLLMETAKRLNVQIFATTHSWDCICAFQEALEQLEDVSVGRLLRLSHYGEDVHAIEYKPEELSVAVRQSIEVR